MARHHHHHGAHHHHGPADADALAHWVERFEAPERVTWQKPAEVIAALSVPRGARVADLGSGTGYFTIALGRAVGPAGRVYAVDTEPAMLRHVAERAAREEAPMITTVHAKPEDPSLPEPVDLAFTVNAFHHVEHRARWLERLVDRLSPDGRVAIIDFHKRTLPMGPPNAMKLSARTVTAELAAAGLRVAERFTFLPYQYFLVFERAPRRAAPRVPRTRRG